MQLLLSRYFDIGVYCMKRFLVTLCICVLSQSVHAALINGGAETGDLSGWMYSSAVEAVSSYPQSSGTVLPANGNYFFSLTKHETTQAWIEQRGDNNFSVGELVDFSGQVQTENVVSSDNDFAVAHFYFIDGENNTISEIYSSNIQTENLSWEQFSISLEVPEGAVKWAAQVNGFGSSISDLNVYFDDMQLNLATVPIPATIWLFGSALTIFCWRRKTASGRNAPFICA